MVGGGSYRVNCQSIGGTYADAPSMLGTPDYNWFNISIIPLCVVILIMLYNLPNYNNVKTKSQILLYFGVSDCNQY